MSRAAFCRNSPATPTAACCPTGFPTPGKLPSTTRSDATLWFFEAIRQYVEHTNDYDLVRRKLYPVLTGIIDFHIAGTRYGIKVDQDGLLNCGEPGVQLTWMDAKIGDWVVTPRYGKPVEIQALWYQRAAHHGRNWRLHSMILPGKQVVRFLWRTRPRAASIAEFWNAEQDACSTSWVAMGPDASIRPNQIFAVSLYYSMLDWNGLSGL